MNAPHLGLSRAALAALALVLGLCALGLLVGALVVPDSPQPTTPLALVVAAGCPSGVAVQVLPLTVSGFVTFASNAPDPHRPRFDLSAFAFCAPARGFRPGQPLASRPRWLTWFHGNKKRT